MSSRAVGLCGVLAFLLGVAVVALVPAFPDPAGGYDAVAQFYGTYFRRFLLGNFLGIIGAVPSLILIAFVAMRLRRAEGEAGFWWLASIAAGIVMHAVGMVDLGVFQAVPIMATTDLQGATNQVAIALFGTTLVTFAAYAGITGLAVLATRALPRWWGLAGALTAIVSFGASWVVLMAQTSLAPFGPMAPFAALGASFGLFFIWILEISLWLLAGGGA